MNELLDPISPTSGLIINPDSTGLRIPKGATTVEGFRTWFASPDFPTDVRVSLIENELFIESRMEDLITHNKLKTIISAILAMMVDDRSLGHFCNDGMLVTHKKARVSTVPDGVFASFESIESGRVRISTIGKGDLLVEWQGSPDWVLEVVSRGSEEKDYHKLLRAYYRAGIPEYWLVDARGDEIDFRIYKAGSKGYEAMPAQEGWIESPVFGRRFRLTRELDRVNLWRYRLHVELLPGASS